MSLVVAGGFSVCHGLSGTTLPPPQSLSCCAAVLEKFSESKSGRDGHSEVCMPEVLDSDIPLGCSRLGQVQIRLLRTLMIGLRFLLCPLWLGVHLVLTPLQADFLLVFFFGRFYLLICPWCSEALANASGLVLFPGESFGIRGSFPHEDLCVPQSWALPFCHVCSRLLRL